MGPRSSESDGHDPSCLPASLFLPVPGACPLLSVFHAMHWQFLSSSVCLTSSNSPTNDQLKITATNATYYIPREGFSKSCPRPAALTSLEKLLERQILGPTPDLLTQKLAVKSRDLCLTRLPGDSDTCSSSKPVFQPFVLHQLV